MAELVAVGAACALAKGASKVVEAATGKSIATNCKSAIKGLRNWVLQKAGEKAGEKLGKEAGEYFFNKKERDEFSDRLDSLEYLLDDVASNSAMAADPSVVAELDELCSVLKDAARAKLDADGRRATLTNIDRHMNSLTVAIAANTNKKVQDVGANVEQLLEGKQGDRKEIAKVLAAVEAGAARDKKIVASVQRDSSKLDDLQAAARRDGTKLDDLQAAARRDGAKLDDLQAAARRDGAKLDDLQAAARRDGTKLDDLQAAARRDGTKLDDLQAAARRGERKLDDLQEAAGRDGTKLDDLHAAARRDGAKLDNLQAAARRDGPKLDDLQAAARRDGAKLDDLQAAACREERKLDDIGAAFREGQELIVAGLERKTKADFNRQTKESQLEQSEIELDDIEEKPFARGGQGEVFMGTYQGEIIVLKKLYTEGVTAMRRQKMLNSFKSELAIMVRLRSPRVVQVFGVVTTNPEFLGFVFEFLQGGSLRQVLDDDGRVEEPMRRVWVSDIARGMAYLYSQGVEHRDLKSANVLLTQEGRAKVADFGLSKCEELKTSATSTMGRGQVGTPAFMAPEFFDENVFSEASDVYSFAIVIWEIWSRQVPWGGLLPMQIMRKVDKGERPPAPAGMPAELRELMVSAWAPAPADRPSFRKIVAEVQVSTPVSTRPAWRGGGAAELEEKEEDGVLAEKEGATAPVKPSNNWTCAVCKRPNGAQTQECGVCGTHKDYPEGKQQRHARAKAAEDEEEKLRREAEDVDLSKLALVRTLEGHSHYVLCVAISPDGRRVVSGAGNSTLKVWDVATGECVATLRGHSFIVRGVAVFPDGRRVVSASDDETLKVWDVATGECVATLKGHSGCVDCVAIAPDGRRIVSGSRDNTLKVWDVATGECVATLQGHSNDVRGVAVFPDGRRVVSASRDKTLKVWDVATCKCVATLKGHSFWVDCVAIAPDGRRVVSASSDETLKVWDVATGECVATLQGHSNDVNCVAISPDGRRVVSASDDKTLKVWDVATGECVATLEGHSSYVYCVAISPDGRRVVSASRDETLKLWEVPES